jgi:hypothetical protein
MADDTPDLADTLFTDDVELWRYIVLITASYTKAQAEALAANKTVDLHQAVELVTERGCDPATAFDILN